MSKTNKIIKYSIFILFILLPIIDCVRRTVIKDISIFGFSLIELVNIVIIGYTLVLTIINLGINKRRIIPIVIYTIILLVYLCLHSLNILSFDTNIFPSSNINVITECYYILRVYYMPVLLLFILINNKEIFNLEFYSKLVKTLICIVCLSIIVLNIFKLSYATYDLSNNEFVKYNIFDFYKADISYKLLSTRGWFDSSNEISAILMMLFPINIFLLYKENKKFNVFLYLIQFIGMIILGTRVSAIGAILITIVTLLINIFSKFIKRDKINMKIVVCGLLCTLYFFVSPVGIYLLNYDIPNFSGSNQYSDQLRTLTDEDEIIDYLNKNLYNFRINREFVTIYPLESDLSFWYDVALRDRSLNNDSREMKSTIIKRLYERNNNKYDKFLGMGYTINFIDIERDYVYQFYLFGLLGIIFIVPQIVSVFKSGICILKKIKNVKIVQSLLIVMSPLLGFVVAYFSGHVFGWVSPSYILVLVIAVLGCFVSSFKQGSESNAKS